MGSVTCNGASGTEMDEFTAKLPSQNLEPLWSRIDAMVPSVPNPRAIPHLWKYKDVFPHLNKAGEIVPEQMAERRVLMLVNPNLDAPHTTDTIYGGLQLVNSGEIAPAHRHIAYACRFIIDGEGFTAVEGKKMPLVRGDVIVTPSWHWHDHGNESSRPVIWLDALNLPLFQFAPVNFAEGYEESRYPSIPYDNCEWRHPWSNVQEALDSQDGSHALYHYRTGEGKPLSTSLGVQAERISGHAATELSRDSCSYIYHCYEGRGHTIVEPPSGDYVVIRWVSKDTFAVPAWSKIQHFNESGAEAAYLVAVHDGPLLDSLGLRRPKLG